MEKNEVQKTNMPGLTTQNQGTGTKGIDVRPQSSFTRCGNISLEMLAVKVTYESFGKTHTAFIGAAGVRSLTGPAQMPCDVEEIQEGADGTEVISQVGKAWRSRSGKALVINTSQSQGELMVPWTGFKKVIEKKVEKARLSRFTPPDKPRPRPSTETGNPMNAGLARGF